MNRYLTFSLALSITLSTLAIPQRAAKKAARWNGQPEHGGWTNDDLEQAFASRATTPKVGVSVS
jgi:hypothetical protein